MNDTLETKASRRQSKYASPGFAPVVNRGVNKTPQIAPERVRELMDEQAKLVEARHAAPKAPPSKWIDLKRPKPAEDQEPRRLASYTRTETRILECRLAVLRRAGVRDPEASAQLDVAMQDLDGLAALAGQV